MKVLLTAAALVSLAACQQVPSLYPTPQPESAPAGPAAVVNATCDALTFRITAPTGADVFIGIGSEPPYGFTVGAAQTWGFLNTDGTYTGTIEVEGATRDAHSYSWNIDIGNPQQRLAEGTVTCTDQSAATATSDPVGATAAAYATAMTVPIGS